MEHIPGQDERIERGPRYTKAEEAFSERLENMSNEDYLAEFLRWLGNDWIGDCLTEKVREDFEKWLFEQEPDGPEHDD